MKNYTKPETSILMITTEEVLLDSIDLPIDTFDEEAPATTQEP